MRASPTFQEVSFEALPVTISLLRGNKVDPEYAAQCLTSTLDYAFAQLHSDCPASVGLGQTLQRFHSKWRNALANLWSAVVQKLDQQHVRASTPGVRVDREWVQPFRNHV